MNIKKLVIIIGLLLSFLYPATATKTSIIYKSTDMEAFSDYVRTFNDKRNDDIGKLIIKTGKFFSGKPYVASTLEIGEKESLVINLTEFDCTTLVETCFALSLMLKDEGFDINKDLDDNFDLFCSYLQKIRYRNGVIGDYASRLHYFTDWIYDNQNKGLIKDMSNIIGGVNKKITVNFMSQHPNSYKQLKQNPALIKEIKESENIISQRTSYSYVPKPDIEDVKFNIKDGDIIAFTTSIAGLDTSHVGFAIWQNNDLYLLHASSTGKKVLVSDVPLSQYTNGIKRHTGIMVVSPL